MENSDLDQSETLLITMLLEAIVAAGVPILVSGRAAERFRNCGLVQTSTELELVLNPDLNCAIAFIKAMQRLAGRFGVKIADVEDASKFSSPSFRFSPFPATRNLDIIVAESNSEFADMTARCTNGIIYNVPLMILSTEDILLLKQRYVEVFRKEYDKHFADLQRIKEKLAAKRG